MDKLNNRATDRGGALRETLSETYLPLESAVLSHTSLSQEYSTKAIVSVGVFRPVAFTNVGGFIWQSSNSAVCNVSKISNFEAEISFLAIGNCEITVNHSELPAKMIACTALPVKLKSYNLDSTGGTWDVGRSTLITIENPIPVNFTNVGGFSWSTSNADVGTVTKIDNTSAIVDFISPGNCTISCNHPDLPAVTVTYRCREVPVESIEISGLSQLKPFKTYQYTSTVLPDNVADKRVAWNIDDISLAKINDTGHLTTYNKAGSTNIIATSARDTWIDGYKAITIEDPLENWVVEISMFSGTLRGIVYADGLYTMVGYAGAIRSTSEFNGTIDRNSGVTNDFEKIVYVNGLYLAVGRGVIVTSPDTITWTNRNIGTTNWVYDVTYGNGLYVAPTQQGILYSSNAITWNIHNTVYVLEGIAYGNGVFVVVGMSGAILTSPNATTWTDRSYEVTNSILRDIIYANNLFVAVGDHGTIATSYNGITWTKRYTDNALFLFSIAYGNGTYVAIGSNSVVLTSSDGTTWTKRNGGYFNSYSDVTYGNGYFAAVTYRDIVSCKVL